jgi:hypothetical protein
LDEEQQRHRGRLLRELETARYELKGMETLSFGVPTREGHDDYLMSPALCAYAAATTPPPPAAQVIRPEEYRPHIGEEWPTSAIPPSDAHDGITLVGYTRRTFVTSGHTFNHIQDVARVW